MVERNPVRGEKIAYYADIHIHGNAVATVINTANIPHLVQGLFSAEFAEGFTFSAGSTGAITAFADAGGGKVTVTSASHTLTDGGIVSISGTTSYNGIFAVSDVAGNDFNITDTWVADDGTGNFYEGDNLVVNAGAEGIYKIDFHSHGVSASANKTFECEIYKNTTIQEVAEAKRRFASNDTGVMGGGGIISVNAGDILTFAIFGITDTTNFTFEHLNIAMHNID